MAWFRCPCGHVAQVTLRDVYGITSVFHLHAVPGSPAGATLCAWRRFQQRPTFPRLSLRSPARDSVLLAEHGCDSTKRCWALRRRAGHDV